MDTRKITVYSTKGQKKKEYNTNVETWEPLRNMLESDGYDMKDLLATETVNKTTLEHNEATLPEGDFIIFLRQAKNKSGIDMSYEDMGFGELRNELTQRDKRAIEKITGKNWTTCSAVEIRQYLTVKSTILAVTEISSQGNFEKIERIIMMLEEICESSDNTSICEAVQDSLEPLIELRDNIKGYDTREPEEQEELDQLDEEARDFMEGFN